MNIKKKYLPLIIFFFIAFLIRFIGISQSFWLDEGTTVETIRKYSLFEIVSVFSPKDFHPPLYYLFMKVWASFFGFSEISLRLPSILFTMFSGWFIYRIGTHIKNESVGIISAFLFLVNPLIMYYSQEARMYMMVVFFIVLNLYSLFELQAGSKKKHLMILFISSIFFSFATFYGSIFYSATILIYLFIKKSYRLFFIALFSTSITVLIVSPLLIAQFMNSRLVLQEVKNWSLVLGRVTIKNLLLIPIKFAGGRISFEPKELYFALAGITTVVVFGTAFFGARKKWELGLFFGLPLFLGLLFSFVSPLLQYFRFLYLILFLSLLMGYALEKKQLLQIFLIEVFLAWSLFYLLFPKFHREDWQGLSRKLPSAYPVYMISSSSDPLRYYSPHLQIRDFKRLELEKPKTIVVLPYTADIHGVRYQDLLKNYQLQKKDGVRGIEYEIWTALP